MRRARGVGEGRFVAEDWVKKRFDGGEEVSVKSAAYEAGNLVGLSLINSFLIPIIGSPLHALWGKHNGKSMRHRASIVYKCQPESLSINFAFSFQYISFLFLFY